MNMAAGGAPGAPAPGAPVPVVLLHGLTDSAACWPTVLHRYEDAGRTVVALNARGHGGSTLPPCGLHAAQFNGVRTPSL